MYSMIFFNVKAKLMKEMRSYVNKSGFLREKKSQKLVGKVVSRRRETGQHIVTISFFFLTN